MLLPAVGVVGLLACGVVARGQEAPPPAPDLRYRRVLVEAGAEPPTDVRLIPMRGADFERLAREAGPEPQPPAARIEEARYECRLVDGAALVGQGLLRVEVEGEPSVVWLDPCNVAIRSIRSRSGRGPLRWGRSPQGRFALWAEASDDLILEWSLAATRLPSRALAFHLELPRAPVAWLNVEAQPTWRAEVRTSGGAPLEPLHGGWPLREARCTLQFHPGEKAAEPASLALRESNLYELSPRGLSLAAEWTLDVQGTLPRLTVELDAPLRLLGARSGEQPLAVSPRVEAGRRLVDIAPEAPWEGANRVLTLAAVAERPLEPDEVLPRIRPVDAFWMQGESTVRVVPPLACFAARHVAGRTLRVAPGASPLQPEVWEFQHFAPDWQASLLPSDRPPALQLRAAALVECGVSRHRALYRAEFRGLPEPTTQLTAHLADGWRIVSLQRENAAASDCDWEQTSDEADRPLLRIHLPQAREGQQFAVRIEAERAAGTLASNDLALLKWTTGAPLAAETTLRATEGARLDIQGDSDVDWRPVDAAALALRWPASASEAWSLDARRLPEELRVETLSAAPPQRAARWIVSAVSRGDSLHCRYEIDLTSPPGAAAELDIQLLPPGSGTVRWSWSEAPQAELPARRLEAAELAASLLPPDAEVWRLAVALSSKGVQRLVGERIEPGGGPQSLGFPHVRDARFEGGELLVASDRPEAVRIETAGLEPLPAVGPGENRPARYRRRADEAGPLGARLARSSEARTSAVVEQRTLLRVGARGAAETEYTWTADGRLARSIEISMPSEAAARRLSVDAKAVPWESGSRCVRVALPAKPDCRAVLSIAPAPGWDWPLRRWRPAAAEVDAQVAHAQWRIELPREWVLLSAALPRAASAAGVENSYAWSGERPPDVWAVRRDVLIVLILAAAMAAALAGSRIGRRDATALVLGLSLALALVLPGPMAWAPLALTGGWIAGCAARFVRAKAGSWGVRFRPSAAARWGAATLLLAVAARSDGQTTHEVYVPTDEQRQPRAEGWLVPEPLVDALLAAGRRERAAPEGVWIERADYRGELIWSGQGQPGLRLVGTLRVHAFAGEGWLRLPWPPALVAAARVTVDGSPAETVGDPDQLRVRLPGPGTFDLETPLAPTIQAAGEGGAAEMPLPSVAASRLELRVSPDLSLAVPSARGSVERDVANRRLIADLGAAPRLTMRWTTQPRSDATPEVEAEQALLLEIRPGAVLLRTKIAYRVRSGAMSELRFTADPRLRWLPLTQEGVATASLAPSSLDPTAATVPLVQSVAGPWNFQATLLLTGHSGVGQLSLPRLEPRDVVLRRRWVAVSVDPTLTREVEVDAQQREASEFESRWGERLPGQTLVFEAAVERWPDCLVRTRPVESDPRAQQRLRHLIDQPESRWELSVRWPAGEHRPPTCRIAVPAGVQVDRLELRSADESRAVRFTRTASGEVEAALRGSAEAGSELIATGRWTSAEGRVELPRISLLEATLVEDAVELWRAGGLRLSPWEDAHELPPLARATGGWQDAWRRVATVSSAKQVPPRLSIRRFRPQARLSQAVYLPDQLQTGIAVAVRVDATDAALDQLEWEIGPAWEAPLTCDPPAEIAVLARPGGQRRLRLRFAESLRSGDRITLQGIRPRNPSEPAAPRFEPRDVEIGAEFLVLPSAESSRLWELEGWREAELPAGFARSESQVSYVAEAPTASAAVRGGGARREPRVVLSEYRVRMAASGQWLAQMKWLVDPRGAEKLWIELDEGARLAAARCDERAVAAWPLAGGGFELNLSSRELPQWIDVLVAGSRGQEQQGQVVAPRIQAEHAAGPLWRVWNAGGAVDLATDAYAERVAPGVAALARWQASIDLLTQAASAADRLDPALRGAWAADWGSRLRAARAEGRAAMAEGNVELARIAEAASAAEAELLRRRPELGQGETHIAAADWIVPRTAPDREFRGGATLGWARRPAPGRPWARAVSALALAALGISLAWHWRRPEESGAPETAR